MYPSTTGMKSVEFTLKWDAMAGCGTWTISQNLSHDDEMDRSFCHLAMLQTVIVNEPELPHPGEQTPTTPSVTTNQ